MADELGTVLDTVRERVRPGAEERHQLEGIVDDLLERTRAAIEERDLDADVRLVGSTARGTWLSGERDVDIFMRFPPDLARAELERRGLEIGYAVLPGGREEYAEHPYVTGAVDGFDVDLVPCYAVESAQEIESAVDRTPFHADYLDARLTPELADEVRLLKQFLTAIDAYGSNLRTRGFSGYLTELLVLEFDSARGVIEAAADWRPPVRLDPAAHGEVEFEDPLVVVDPTDPTRNVAAVCSADNLARFQHHARSLLTEPREAAFVPDPPAPLDAPGIREELDRRGTTPVAVVFDPPDLVDDDLYPQLRRSLAGIGDALERHGFDVLRTAAFAAEEAVLLFELEVRERPPVERHVGPPVHVREHAEAFLEAWADADAYGPFIEDGRYVVERERSVTDAVAFLESDAVSETRLGVAVGAALAADRTVLVGHELAELAEQFGADLAAYFEPSP